MISPFLKDLLKLNDIGNVSTTFQVGNGQSIKFWTNISYQGCALFSSFSFLFQNCANSSVSLQEVVHSQGTVFIFTRSLSGMLHRDWQELMGIIHEIKLNSNEADSLHWRWNDKEGFTTQSVYEWLMFRGVTVQRAMLWWQLKIPPKIKNFM